MRSIRILGFVPLLAACGANERVGAMAPRDQMPAPNYPGIATTAPEPKGTEAYEDYGINPTTDPTKDRLSTFAVDVDTASYTISRRKLMQENTLPPYAAVSVREILAPTGDKASIVRGIDSLSAGGSTAMASGIQLAYDLAQKTAKPNSVNRVVVLSDGDANVGNSSPDGVVSLIKQYRGK